MPLVPLATLFTAGVSGWFTDARTRRERERLESALSVEGGVSRLKLGRTRSFGPEECGPGRDAPCAYHATRYTSLPSIALYGLDPQEPVPDLRLDQPVGVYFSPTSAFALHWNNVLLRFPWPDDAQEDPHSEGVMVQDEYTRTGFYSERTVPPELIEVRTKDGWQPLLEPEHELSVCLGGEMAREVIEDHFGDDDPQGLGPGCLSLGELIWTGRDVLSMLDVDVHEASLATMLDRLRDQGFVDVQLHGPWRTEPEPVEMPPGTLWRMITVDLEPGEDDAPETIVFSPRKPVQGVFGEDRTIHRISVGPSPEMAIYAIDPGGGALMSPGGPGGIAIEEYRQKHLDWSPFVWAMYVNSEPVTATIPPDTLLPDARVTGETWLLEPARFELVFVLTPREARRIGKAVRLITKDDDQAHREAVLAIHRHLHHAGRLTGERYGEDPSMEGWRKRVVQYVSGHEGGYASTNRNTDGQGLSYGIIQWTQSSGNLGRLLRAMQRKDPEIFAEVFGPDWQELLEQTWKPGIRRTEGANVWNEPWLSRFRRAGAVPAFREVQLGTAMYGEWMQGAVEAAVTMGISPPDSLRAMTLLFDRSVQQGPERVVKIARRVAERVGRGANEADKLASFARSITSNLYRNSRPERTVTSSGLVWKQVGDLWHLYTSTGIDLYSIVRRRIDNILRDRSL